MDNVRHTPGPLTTATEPPAENCLRIVRILDSGGRIVADTYGAGKVKHIVEDWPTDAEASANADLMAAAPDLLAALADLVKWLDDSGQAKTTRGGVWPFNYEPVEFDVVTAARAAIAKATGGT